MNQKILCSLIMLSISLAIVFPAKAIDPTATPALETCPLADQTLNIAWIPKALNNPVFELGRIAAETRAAELTDESPCRVEIFYVAPMTSTAQDQADLIMSLIELGNMDAIGISCIDPHLCLDPINAAIEAGIAVMTWDSDSPESNRLTYLSMYNFAGGQVAADLLAMAMEEHGKVAILSA